MRFWIRNLCFYVKTKTKYNELQKIPHDGWNISSVVGAASAAKKHQTTLWGSNGDQAEQNVQRGPDSDNDEPSK